MKTRIIATIICCMAFLTACEEDGSIIKLSGLDSSELLASESSLVLTKETASNSVLALTWSKSTLTASDPAVTIPSSVPRQIIEVSASADFDTYSEITPQGTTYAFTGAALNTLGKNLGLTAGESAPVYFRINMAYSSNTDSYYSNVVTVNVTCYTIDMSIGFILDSGKEDTGFTLYSPDSDGEYSGFTGVTAWYNWYLLEGDGTIWGNLGVDGYPFVISNDESSFWNFWYPGLGGCYYATLSTGNEEWTATYIPSLTVSGDIDATMTFDKTNVKWYASFTTTGADAVIKVTCDAASLYNASTGTDDASAIAKTIGFIPQPDSTVTFVWDNTAAGTITIAEAGDYTLLLFLDDPTHWTYRVKSGLMDVVEPISGYLYLPGIDDGISGGWNFNNYLGLVSEDDSTFAGIINVNSLYGYQMTLTVDDWENIYALGSAEGLLEFKSSTNIPAPDPGLYLIQADLKNLTYSHTEVTGVSYAGLNGDWSVVALDATSVTGVYSGAVTISAVSAYGMQILINGDWGTYYGGADGVLSYKGQNIVDDATIGTGTYDLITDVINETYVFLGNEIYVAGLNNVWDFTSVVLSKTSAGVYSGSATITATSSYGIQIHLDQSWNRYYGGSFSSLVYLGSNITDDQSLTAGTYNITVDFINNTCTFTAL